MSIRWNRSDVGVVATALFGAWLLWSQYSTLSTLSWWYDRVATARSRSALPNPDYDLRSLRWQQVSPRVFDLQPDRLILVTNTEPNAYQAFAVVTTGLAKAADIQFDIDVESGGVTVGLIQDGKWIAASSSVRTGSFADSNSTQLGLRRSLMVMIANNNPAGESRVVVKALRVYVRRWL